MWQKFFVLTLLTPLAMVWTLDARATDKNPRIVFLDCRTTSNEGPYAIKDLNLWIFNESSVRISFYDSYTMTEDLERDERRLSEKAVFHVKWKSGDWRLSPDGPVSVIKIDPQVMALLQTQPAKTPFEVASRGRKVIGQVRLLGNRLKEVAYDCREP